MIDLIQSRLKQYNIETSDDELNALKEITQKLILYHLGQTDFFQKALFGGGTCLRIIHGIGRFSEDLNFSLVYPDAKFDLSPYLQKVRTSMNVYGYKMEISDERYSKTIKTGMLKDNSVKKLLSLGHHADMEKKIRVKIEVDTNPPQKFTKEANYIDFPKDFMIMTHDPPSLFAGKCHALLCRKYTKGRDWYDYFWFLRRGTPLNWEMLECALRQFGPWQQQEFQVTSKWLQKELRKKMESLDINAVREEIRRFIPSRYIPDLDIWSKDFFLKSLRKIEHLSA